MKALSVLLLVALTACGTKPGDFSSKELAATQLIITQIKHK